MSNLASNDTSTFHTEPLLWDDDMPRHPLFPDLPEGGLDDDEMGEGGGDGDGVASNVAASLPEIGRQMEEVAAALKTGKLNSRKLAVVVDPTRPNLVWFRVRNLVAPIYKGGEFVFWALFGHTPRHQSRGQAALPFPEHQVRAVCARLKCVHVWCMCGDACVRARLVLECVFVYVYVCGAYPGCSDGLTMNQRDQRRVKCPPSSCPSPYPAPRPCCWPLPPSCQLTLSPLATNLP